MRDADLPPFAQLLRQRSVQIALVLSLALRLVFIAIPQLPHYTNDSDGYVNPGVNLFSHGSFAMICEPTCVPTLWRTPGYPLVVGFVVGLLKLPLGAVYVLQAFFDSFTTLLVAAIGVAFGGWRVGVTAAFIHALNPFSAVFAGQIMTESMTTLMLMVAAWAAIRFCRPEALSRRGPWFALGSLLGFATLVRPALGLLPACFALAAFTRSTWRPYLIAWCVAAMGFAMVLAPWVVRNWVVTRDGKADDSFQVLASFTSPFYRRITKPGLTHWYQTFEEPFVWDRPREPPVVAKYFLPNEKERVDTLFEGMRAANLEVTPELDAGFEQLARDRRAAHPFRTTILPPVSRAVRLWITPRLGSFGVESARLAGLSGELLFAAATLYGTLIAALGFVTGLRCRERTTTRILLAVPAYLTLFHAFVMWGNQARYTVPAFPEITVLAAMGVVLLFDRVRRGRAQAES